MVVLDRRSALVFAMSVLVRLQADTDHEQTRGRRQDQRNQPPTPPDHAGHDPERTRGASTTTGVAFLAGMITPLARAALVGVMVNAIGSAKTGKGPWYFNGGWEYDLTLLVAAAALVFTGPGEVSLDAAIGLDAAGWGWGLGALALGLISGQAVLTLRQRLARGAGTQEALA